MKRSDAIDLLEAYNKFLMEEGYADADLYYEKPTAIDGFLLSKWGKEHLPLNQEDSTPPMENEIIPEYLQGNRYIHPDDIIPFGKTHVRVFEWWDEERKIWRTR